MSFLVSCFDFFSAPKVLYFACEFNTIGHQLVACCLIGGLFGRLSLARALFNGL